MVRRLLFGLFWQVGLAILLMIPTSVIAGLLFFFFYQVDLGLAGSHPEIPLTLGSFIAWTYIVLVGVLALVSLVDKILVVLTCIFCSLRWRRSVDAVFYVLYIYNLRRMGNIFKWSRAEFERNLVADVAARRARAAMLYTLLNRFYFN